MINRVLHTLIALAVLSALCISCSEDRLWQNPQTGARDGCLRVDFTADIPEMQEVVTRSVDKDGGGVQNMSLFCFDSYGLFISTAKANVTVTNPGPEPIDGKFSADVPENTRTIHFLANQNMDEFKEDDFRNKSEAAVMALLEGSSGRMIYWSRFACASDNTADIAEQIKTRGNNKIQFIRNHAKISVDNPDNNWIKITGFAVCNINAFGTVAPYHPKKGFDFDWKTIEDFVTLPVNDAKMSGIDDVTTDMGQYVFESENSLDDPVSVILKGHLPTSTEELYYRVLLVDKNGDQLKIRRNHHYKLNITGTLSFGQGSFSEALKASATNNIWISISDEVNEVEDQKYILAVEKTAVVLGESDIDAGAYTLSYTIKGKDGTTVSGSDAAKIDWADNEVASSISTTFEVDKEGVGQGKITINLLTLGDKQKHEGTLIVKKGRLQRKIKVITIKKQSFVPTWVASQVYGGINQTEPTTQRSHVTVMFTIPETCPDELFPMRVLISANDVDIRNESGMQLTVVREGENTDFYGDSNGIGYKYVYMVEKEGVQRVYFENILKQNQGDKVSVTIEAEHFEKITKEVTYAAERNSITVVAGEYMKKYDANASDKPATVEPADDEYIYYYLVPQKANAPVEFNIQLMTKTGDELADDGKGAPFNAGDNDEFLLYSQYLSDAPAGENFDCIFHDATAWWQQNNPDGGRMLMFMPINPTNPSQGTGKYSIHMHTNRAKSAEVVRIASNENPNKSVLSDVVYSGNSYRSVTFELANYNPFRFAARINDEGTDPDVTDSKKNPEEVTPLTWSYQPGQKVEISFDVTSFTASDGKSVNPFGTEFEIYIDAPMLELGDNPGLGADKLYELEPGRFVYKVAADRDTERAFFPGSQVEITDAKATNQTGERKTLNFLTSSIVSAGDIVISSNEEQVVYYEKTFSVSNSPISGTLRYTDENGVVQNVPAGAFVAFERVSNGSRIGSVTLDADGKYKLSLRKEYSFNWYNDQVRFRYELNGTVYYGSATGGTLANLFASPNVTLAAKQ